MRTLAEWLTLQEAVHPKSIDLELTRVAAVARALGIEAPEFPVITVAGTNGKGSVVAHLEALFGVGLGGRLDATNLVAADVAVLVSVGFDHSDWLGGTLDLIGAEKAGIFRAGRPAVLGTPEMPASVSAAIESLGARAVIAERDFNWRLRGESWDYEGLELALRALPPSALAGSIQYRNAATALPAVE